LPVAAAVQSVPLALSRACSSGATPLWRASCASLLKRLIGPISASSFAAVTAPQPGSSSSADATVGRPLFEFLVELVDRPRQRATAGDKLTCDPHLDFLLTACQPAADALELTRTVESAQRNDQGRIELVQVPAQPLLGSPPLVDAIVTMMNQQLELTVHQLLGLRPWQIRLAQRRPGDRERVDRVRFAARPTGRAFRHRQLRRDPRQLLAQAEQLPVQPGRQKRAVLQRPQSPSERPANGDLPLSLRARK
jgi:hypothetical protein